MNITAINLTKSYIAPANKSIQNSAKGSFITSLANENPVKVTSETMRAYCPNISFRGNENNTEIKSIQQNIIETLKSGDDVIIGYVLTNETAGITKNAGYNENLHGKPNQVINGHEITIVDYIQDKSGKISFVCVDTDDNSHDFVVYSADWLLPKIHHAGYPANIVAEDEKEIMSQVE